MVFLIDTVLDIGAQGLALPVISHLYKFFKWFYLTLLPFAIQYVGIPMFALGILLALSFAGGTLLFIIIFFVFIYFFIKGTIFNSNPVYKL